MFLLSNANNLWMLGLIFIMLVCLVVFLPLIDTKICKKIGVSLTHGISDNPKATYFLRIRKIVLYCILVLYLAVNLYLVVFSRSASQDYYVNTAFMYDLTNSIKCKRIALANTFAKHKRTICSKCMPMRFNIL